MVSTTSGTTSFTLDVDDIIDQATDPFGDEYKSSFDIVKARRALNLFLIELQNKNVPIHKIDVVTQALTSGVSEYTLNISVSDVLEVNLKDSTSNTETPLTRYGLKKFHEIPIKTQENRPTVFTTERNRDQVTVKLWPIPNAATYSLEMLAVKKIEDVTASYQKLDIPYRYFPLVVAGLSYKISLGVVGLPADIRMGLRDEYEKIQEPTFDEDRERADFHIEPGGISGW